MTLSGLHVVRVEEVRILRVNRTVVACVRMKNKSLEEPADMREVPFGRTNVFHRLNNAVLRGEWCCQAFRGTSNGSIPLEQTVLRADNLI